MFQHPSSNISSYFKQAERYPRLSREREMELARRWKSQRDERAAEELVLSHLRFVVTIATKYRHYQVPVGDLVSEGSLGLLVALDKFDPEMNNRFVTYASFWIRAKIVSYILANWSIARAGAGPLRSKLFFKLRRERARALSEFGAGPECDAALEERLGIKSEKLKRMFSRLDQHDVSLNQAAGPDRQDTLLDVLPSEEPLHDVGVAQDDSHSRATGLIHEALEQLDPREHFIATHRLMADRDDELSLAEIGRRLGVTRERARQLETRAKKKMRTVIERLSRRAGTDPRDLLVAA